METILTIRLKVTDTTKENALASMLASHQHVITETLDKILREVGEQLDDDEHQGLANAYEWEGVLLTEE